MPVQHDFKARRVEGQVIYAQCIAKHLTMTGLFQYQNFLMLLLQLVSAATRLRTHEPFARAYISP